MQKEIQKAKILRLLRKSHVSGVPNYKFQQYNILCYTKVISELRHDGHIIVKERVYDKFGKATGVYKYHLVERDLENYEMPTYEEDKSTFSFKRLLGLK